MSTIDEKYRELHSKKRQEILDTQKMIRELQAKEQKDILELARLEGSLTVLDEIKAAE